MRKTVPYLFHYTGRLYSAWVPQAAVVGVGGVACRCEKVIIDIHRHEGK